MANIKIYIPTFVSDQNFTPARVNPRAFFYNGTLDCEPFLIESNDGGVISQTEIPAFPYFDHYSLEPGGTQPGPSSNSLLFLNENAVYGTPPTSSLYDGYWEKYVSLLYDPATRLLDASAIISLADYNEMELNDIVQFRGNYFHLRAINEYDVKTGVCKIQLLGPILGDAIDRTVIAINCEFDFTAVNQVGPTTTTTSTTVIPTTTTSTTTTIATYEVEYLVLAGGGAGGTSRGGGGGAGGHITPTTTITSGTVYPIIVGAGGAPGFNGNTSSALGVSASGGGAGGSGAAEGSRNGFDGGSGGGGSGYFSTTSGGSGISGQGNNGGDGLLEVGQQSAAGGGGGANQVGDDASAQGRSAGDGGSGKDWRITYLAGGGGGSYSGYQDGTSGNSSFGGVGALDGFSSGGNANANTGGGGGGGFNETWTAGAGGSGRVMISYVGTPKGTGGTITQSGGRTYHTFNSSGTFTA